MDGGTVQTFNALLDKNPKPEDVTGFIQYNVPNRELVARQALEDFRKQFLP
jgi:hypothetical protein